MRIATFAVALLVLAATACGGTQTVTAPPGDATEPSPIAVKGPPTTETGLGASDATERVTDSAGVTDATASAADSVATEQQPGGASPAPTGQAATPDPTVQALAASFEFPRRGRADAPLTIFEFSDYLCPYCSRFALETAPRIQAEYVATGQVSMVFVDLPILQLHGYATLVMHEAAHCASDAGRYWEMHDALFGGFQKLSQTDPMNEAAARAAAGEVGRGIGLDPDRMRNCLESQKYRPIIMSIAQDADKRGVKATPSILVGTELVQGYLPYDDLKPIIERELAKALGTELPGATDAPATLGP